MDASSWHSTASGGDARRHLDAERRLQRAHWEAVAHRLPDLFGAPSTQHYRRREMALVDRHLGPLAGKRILKLDLWNEAVNTRLMQWMEGQGAYVYGIDLSRTTAHRARRNFVAEGRRGGFLQADIRGLPFASGSFDCVYTMGTIEHIAEYELAIREVCRVLKDGGTAVIGVPHKWDPFLRPLIVWALERFKLYPYSPERVFSARALRAAVERNGLRVTQRTGLLFLPGALRLVDLLLHTRGNVLSRLTPALLWPFEIAESRWSWARRLGYLVTVVARKESRTRTVASALLAVDATVGSMLS
jgi:SAM-dependent methyltransferase